MWHLLCTSILHPYTPNHPSNSRLHLVLVLVCGHHLDIFPGVHVGRFASIAAHPVGHVVSALSDSCLLHRLPPTTNLTPLPFLLHSHTCTLRDSTVSRQQKRRGGGRYLDAAGGPCVVHVEGAGLVEVEAVEHVAAPLERQQALDVDADRRPMLRRIPHLHPATAHTGHFVVCSCCFLFFRHKCSFGLKNNRGSRAGGKRARPCCLRRAGRTRGSER